MIYNIKFKIIKMTLKFKKIYCQNYFNDFLCIAYKIFIEI